MEIEPPISNERERLDTVILSLFKSQSNQLLWSGPDSSSIRLGVGTGDDCASLDVSGSCSIVIGSDYVRGPKFTLYQLGYLSEKDLGYYLVAANASDIAAMGAQPLVILTVVRYPADLTDIEFHELMIGIADACEAFGLHNVGGDIGSAERIILSATALGVCSSGRRPLRRDSVQPGDVVCCTGPTGTAGAAVLYFSMKERFGWSLPIEFDTALLDSWRRPQPRIYEGIELNRTGVVTGCQDTSDGLLATLQQLSTASSVGFEIKESNVPVTGEVETVARLAQVDPVTLAISASVDFHLVFTMPPHQLDRCRLALKSSNTEVVVLGEANATGEVTIRSDDGSVRAATGFVWSHQPGDIGNNMLQSLRTDAADKSDVRH